MSAHNQRKADTFVYLIAGTMAFQFVSATEQRIMYKLQKRLYAYLLKRIGASWPEVQKQRNSHVFQFGPDRLIQVALVSVEHKQQTLLTLIDNTPKIEEATDVAHH